VNGEDSELERALEQAGPDHSTLVLVESGDGLAGHVVELIPARFQPPLRAAGAEASRAKAGCLANAMDLEAVGDRAIVIENAQWVDPTSMGRVQRLLGGDERAHLIVVAHTPVAPEDSWWLEQLAATAERDGELIFLELDGAEQEGAVEPPADARERDLLLAARLVSDPISVPLAARFLASSEAEALEMAESLAQRGFLEETRSGFRASVKGLSARAGEARVGHVAERLARAFQESGEDPAVVGSLYLTAGDHRAAYPLLRDAAQTADARSAGGEAYHLAISALDAADAGSQGSKGELGSLHLICGRHLRAVGRSDAAARHLEAAVSLLEGPTRIDALGFAAAVADDRQHPQEAERILAIAEWESVVQGEPAKLGSLGTFRARALNRIGFAAESDAILAKSVTILDEHATPAQQFFGRLNKAWILFDRGRVAEAEVEFTHLRDDTDLNDLAGLADKEAWRARSLFATGHPSEAIEAVVKARELATMAEVEAPLFLADLALTEGALSLGRPEAALEAAERVLDLVVRVLPAWENVARANRALALLQLGQVSEAEAEVEAALSATPTGADGWRWRSRCRAIQIEIAAQNGSGFPQREAEDLADMFLQSEFYGWGAELLCVIAGHTKSEDAAREAMALAIQIGNPMLAARAASAGKLWKDPNAAPVIRALRAMEGRIPESWEEAWRGIPAVAEGLEAPEPSPDETGDLNAEVLESALSRAGLITPDAILSPAQRRAKGLVTRRRRALRPLTVIAAALGVIILTVGTSLAVVQLNQADPPATIAATGPATTAAPPTLEETEIEVPVDLLFGTALDRGDIGRSGYVDVAGPRSVDGYYWIFQAADAIVATPLAYGNNLLVGSADGTFQALDLTHGASVWSMPAEDQIATSAGLGTASLGEGRNAGLVVVVADDGIVRSRDAVIVEDTELWQERLGPRIRSSPVVDGEMVYVATTDGRVHGLELTSGVVVWTYPSSDTDPLGPITAGLALDNGIIYVGTEDGGLHLINTDGTLHCETTLDGSIRVNPVVVDGLAYISIGSIIRIFPVGVCDVLVSDIVQYVSESVVDVAPAVVGDLIYVPNGIFLNAIDRVAIEEGVTSPEEAHHWSPGKVRANGKIASPPVVTQDAVYFGTETGWVYAVDSDTGDLLWEWRTANYVRASPVVIAGAVYIASGDGRVYAVGPAG